MKRRSFVVSGAAAAGALLVGWGLLPMRSRLGSADTLPVAGGEIGLNGWIKVLPDGSVALAMHRSEMGQGVHTALAMLVAEELDISLAKLHLVQAGPDKLYGNVAGFVAALPLHPTQTEPGSETNVARLGSWIVGKVARELGIHMTGGSSSVADAWDVLRLAAATARAQLLGAASLRWKLPLDELGIVDGVVSHASGPSAHFGELAAAAAATPSGAVTPKAAKDWKLIGRGVPRTDLPSKTDGSAVYGVDVRLPQLLFAVVRHAPMLGGGIGAVDVDAVLRLPGVERVVRLGPLAGSTAALAVVGRSSWHALRGAQALQVQWQPPPAGTLDSAAIVQDLERQAREAAAAQGGFTFYSRGDAAEASRAATRRIEQVYRAPYLAHAALEPINCTARVAEGRVEVWVPTQVPGMARALAAQVAGVAEDAVTLHVTQLGGGFGRRLDVDVVGQAVRVALETGGRPVQLLWPREEDMRHDFYRPAAAALLRAGIDAQGRINSLQITSAGDAITPRWLERCMPALATRLDLPDKTTSEGLFDLPYGVPHQRMAHVATHSGVPVGFWRSVGHSHNAFFSESFIDELATDAREDPVAFRLALLGEMPRHAAVLKLAADKAGWPGFGAGRSLLAGRARGVALHESFGSIVAQVVEVSLEGGVPRVHRVVCAADVGTVVNPAIVAQQLEGAIMFGLAAALWGRIDIVASAVRQGNFNEVRLPLLADTPRIETHLVASTRSPGGVGEIGTPPLAPAIANALFVLTGVRRRELPLA
jgi:isoquinoline 1-oxidoreductase beta subunit